MLKDTALIITDQENWQGLVQGLFCHDLLNNLQLRAYPLCSSYVLVSSVISPLERNPKAASDSTGDSDNASNGAMDSAASHQLLQDALQHQALAHHACVNCLCHSIAALPLRYSPLLHDPEALAQRLQGMVDVLETAWQRSADCLEVVLRIDLQDAAAPRPGQPDKDYLRRRLQQQQWTQHYFESLHSQVLSAVRDYHQEALYNLRGEQAYSASFLVARSQLHSFQQTLEQQLPGILEHHATLRILGPWAAYSFSLSLPEAEA